MKIGLLADAHGNALALAACLRALGHVGVDQTYFLGDAVGYFPGERDVLRLLQSRQVLCQRGNHEAMLLGELSIAPGRDRIYGLAAARKRLSADERALLASWLDQRVIAAGERRLLLVHGSPANPLEGYVYPDTDLSAFDALPYDGVLMGHTHYPFVTRRNGMLIVNVGSCGLPRDEGDTPAFAVYTPETHSCEIFRLRLDSAGILAQFGAAEVAEEVRQCVVRKASAPIFGERIDGALA